ncbi:MAG: hypothetical protein ABIR84_00400 [Candidatus Nitrotoga sp.]
MPIRLFIAHAANKVRSEVFFDYSPELIRNRSQRGYRPQQAHQLAL